MNFTKSTLLTAICGAGLLVSATAFAAPNAAAFQAIKEAQIANLQERQQIVQKHLTCVQAAQDHAALKVCREAAKEDNKALGAKIKAQRVDKKAQRDSQKQAPAESVAPATPAAPATH